MRTIHYSIRFAIVLVVVSLFYLGVTFLFHQAVQLPALIGGDPVGEHSVFRGIHAKPLAAFMAHRQRRLAQQKAQLRPGTGYSPPLGAVDNRGHAE